MSPPQTPMSMIKGISAKYDTASKAKQINSQHTSIEDERQPLLRTTVDEIKNLQEALSQTRMSDLRTKEDNQLEPEDLLEFHFANEKNQSKTKHIQNNSMVVTKSALMNPFMDKKF